MFGCNGSALEVLSDGEINLRAEDNIYGEGCRLLLDSNDGVELYLPSYQGQSNEYRLPVYVYGRPYINAERMTLHSLTGNGGAWNIVEVYNGPSVMLGVGSGLTNHGLYSNDLNGWIVYSNGEDIFFGNGQNLAKRLTRGNFTTTQHSVSTGSVAANTDSGDKTATFTKSGYYPYGIVGINMAGTNRMYQNIYEYRLSSRSNGSATVTYRFRNNSSSAFSGTIYFDILWIEIL